MDFVDKKSQQFLSRRSSVSKKKENKSMFAFAVSTCTYVFCPRSRNYFPVTDTTSSVIFEDSLLSEALINRNGLEGIEVMLVATMQLAVCKNEECRYVY